MAPVSEIQVDGVLGMHSSSVDSNRWLYVQVCSRFGMWGEKWSMGKIRDFEDFGNLCCYWKNYHHHCWSSLEKTPLD